MPRNVRNQASEDQVILIKELLSEVVPTEEFVDALPFTVPDDYHELGAGQASVLISRLKKVLRDRKEVERESKTSPIILDMLGHLNRIRMNARKK